MAERVITYIDGFNLYFGLKSSNWRRYYWLDLYQLAQNLLKAHQELIAVRYFTSRISEPPDKQKRQATYLEALSTLPKVTIIYGRYQTNDHYCPHCRRLEKIPNEKMTDVNIAVELLSDAYADLFDTALLISADSDLTAPVSRVQKLFPTKRVVLGFPPKRSSKGLMSVAAASFTIGRAMFERSLLPETVTKPDGFTLHKPASWK